MNDTDTQIKHVEFGGDFPPYGGLDGRIVKEQTDGVWITLRGILLNGKQVDIAWAYEYAESILSRLFGKPYYADVVTVFARHREYREFVD